MNHRLSLYLACEAVLYLWLRGLSAATLLRLSPHEELLSVSPQLRLRLRPPPRPGNRPLHGCRCRSPTCRALQRAPAGLAVPPAELLRTLTLVFSDVVEARSPVETGAGGAGVRLPCNTTTRVTTRLTNISCGHSAAQTETKRKSFMNWIKNIQQRNWCSNKSCSAFLRRPGHGRPVV